MKTLSRTCLRRILIATAVAMTVNAAPVGAHNGSSGHRTIKGVWNVRVNITNCVDGAQPGSKIPGPIVLGSFDAMNIFGADGTFLDTNSTDPKLQSQHFGYWRQRGAHRFEFAMKFFLFDPTGQSIGWRIVRHDVVLSRSGLRFDSGGTAETFNNDGELLPPPGAPAGTPPGPGCSVSTATRLY